METTEFIMGLVSTILSLGIIGFLIYYYFYTRNRERMAMIEKGADARLFYAPKKPNSHSALKWALLIIGFGVGLFLAILIDSLTELKDEPTYFSMIFLFGGLGLLAYYFITRRDVQNGDK